MVKNRHQLTWTEIDSIFFKSGWYYEYDWNINAYQIVLSNVYYIRDCRSNRSIYLPCMLLGIRIGIGY